MNRRKLAWLIIPAALLFYFYGPKMPQDQHVRFDLGRLESPTEVRLELRSPGEFEGPLREATLSPAGRRFLPYDVRVPSGTYRFVIEAKDKEGVTRDLSRDVTLDGAEVTVVLSEAR